MMRRFCVPLSRALIVSALALAGCLWLREESMERAHPYGKYTERQVMDRAAAIYMSLVPNAPQVHIEVDHSPQEATLHAWNAECSEPTRRNPVHLRWDAETGLLQSLGRPGWIPVNSSGEVLTTEQVRATSQAWLYALGFCDEQPSYRLIGKPQRQLFLWRVLWRGAGQNVEISLDARGGELVTLHSWASSLPKTPFAKRSAQFAAH